MLKRLITYLLFLFAGLFVQELHGQLTADAAWTASTDYATTSPDDPVFCFSEETQMIIRFEADDLQTINWYRYNPDDNSWDNFVAGGDDQLIVDETGGYRVVAEDGSGNTVDERCWVFNTQALADPEVAIEYDDCFDIELSASCDSVPLLFYDPADGTPGGVKYERRYSWGTLPPVDEQPSGDRVTFDAPYEDMTYIVTVTDRFGHEKEASVDYEAIAVKADFETEVLKDAPDHERHDKTEGSAPLEIQFTDESQGNITAREWTFGDAGRSVDQNPAFVFTEAGKDTVTLRVRNRDSGCEDVSEPHVVNVMESDIDVPNVFTPNGDGVNDEFRVAYRSLKEFEMVIFNRWGRKVYESTDPEEGWDGTVGGKVGAPGVYFYHIKGEGYNDDEVHKKEGPVHLIRDK